MSIRYFGQPVTRNEDQRLLTGSALFIDDVELPGMLHAALLRSPYAHARILSIDISAALARPGVVAVHTVDDLGALPRPGPLAVPPPPVEGAVFHQRTQTALAKDVVRHVGEAVAIVIAQSRYIAEDALGDIEVDWDPQPVAADLEESAAPAAPKVHADLPDYITAKVRQTKGDYAAAARAAHTIIKRRFRYDHGASMPMETRGTVAQWDAKALRLTMWDTTQAPVAIRNVIAAVLGLSERQMRVIAPFIGGAFGPKIMAYYPEELLVPWAAMRLYAPVKWIEDRSEHFTSTTHEREQIHDAEIALSGDGRILGVKDDFLCDTGAYDPYGLTVPLNSQCTLLGPYDIANYDSGFRVIFTHKTTVTPYRGAGRQHGVFVIERLLDIAARELGIDRTEIRRRNFIPPDAFPYDQKIIYQDFSRLSYDSGNYEPMLDKLKAMIGYDEFLATGQAAHRAGAQAMIVEIDPETMMLKILKFAMVHDCGTVINPLIVEGQVQGGIAQGIGNPFFEKLVYDGEGQLLNASLADYLLPTSLDVPHIELEHTVTPSPLNPLGIKGVGEAGAIPVGPLYAQAIEDALGLPDTGVEILEIPLGPGRLWESQRKIEISITQIAEVEGLDLGRASRIARLAQLAPDIVEACATGVAAHLTLENVGRRANPLRWDEQRERLRFR